MSAVTAKQQGFTLIELVIVLVLIGISSVISLRFISDMARSQVAAAERAQALSGARFAIERLRRELSQAYSPSVYITNVNDQHCINFVPVIGAGAYSGLVTKSAAQFILPLSVINTPEVLESAFMAIDASSLDDWRLYPDTLPANMMKISKTPADIKEGSVNFLELFGEASLFNSDNARSRFTLLRPEQVRFCLQDTELKRQVKNTAAWSEPVLMLNGVSGNQIFNSYNETLRLVTLDLNIKTRDGDLALSTQLQVNYEP